MPLSLRMSSFRGGCHPCRGDQRNPQEVQSLDGYQWYLNGEEIDGATGASYSTAALGAGDAPLRLATMIKRVIEPPLLLQLKALLRSIMVRALLVPLPLMLERTLSITVSPFLLVISPVTQKVFNQLMAISGISMTPQLRVQPLKPTIQKS